MPQEKSAGAVIFYKEKEKTKYLLLHYESGHWDFPKGNIEKGEEEKETVKREIKEETGLEDIKFISGFKEWIKYFYKNTYNLKEKPARGGSTPGRKVPWTFKIVTFYLAKSKTKEVKISFEHKGYQWLGYKEALKKLTFKNAKEILEKAHNFLENDSISKQSLAANQENS